MLRLPIGSALKRSRLAYALSRSSARATLVTAAQKRALNEKQLSGKDATSTTSSEDSKPITGTPITSSTISQVGGGDSTQSSGGSMVIPVTALLAVATGAAYYMDFLPGFSKTSPTNNLQKDKVVVSAASNLPVAIVDVTKDSSKASSAAPLAEKQKKPKAEKVISEVAVVDQPLNRVVQIQSFIPSSDEIDRRIHEQNLLSEIALQHDPDGHRVTVVPQLVDLTVPQDLTPTVTATTMESSSQTSLVEHAMSELGLDRDNTITVDETLKRAHALLKGSLDESFLVDLESLSPAQLRVRVVQLVSEMAERTKWEAVRLKEFLALKEREVTDR